MRRNVMMHNLGFHDINPLVCGSQRCVPGHQWGPATRDYYLLHYVHSGQGSFETPRGKGVVKAGQIFVIRPGEQACYTADRGSPWTYGWIGFTCGFSVDEALYADVLDAPGCAHIFRALEDSGHIDNGREWYICAKIYELLSLLASTTATKQNTAAQYVRMAQNYIESQYVEPIKIEQIAKHLNLNRSYFSKIFKTHTGKSPQDYLVDFRLQKAAELLAARGLSPGEASRMVGYADVFNFSRMFRRRYGVSPSHYRGRHQHPTLE